MRIALVTSEYVTEQVFDGGLANYLQRLALALKAAGHEPVVFVSSDRNEVLWHKDIEVHRVSRVSKLNKFLATIMFGAFSMTRHILHQSKVLNREIRKAHDQNPFDVIQYSQLAAVGLYRPKHIPSVVRISSFPLLFNRKGNGCPGGLVILQQHFFEKLAIKRIKHIYGPSKFIAEMYKGYSRYPIKIIQTPFFVETKDLDPSIYNNLAKGKRFLLFFGTLNELKGVPLIAEILDDLFSTHEDLYFVFIGKEWGRYKGGSMMNYVWSKAPQHKDRILWTGRLPHSQLYPFLANAEAVLLPSRADNFPNTCLEAMAHGRVVIGTRGTSFEEIITDGENGFLCNSDDAKDLLETTKKILNLSFEERQRIQNSALERMKSLDPSNIIGTIVEFYQNVIELRGHH